VNKLPVISGAECIKALKKIGLSARGSHITIVRTNPPSQVTIPNHKELDRHFTGDYSADRVDD